MLQVPLERAGQDQAERSVGTRLAGDQVRGEIQGEPTLAERRRVGSDLDERVAQVGALAQQHFSCGHDGYVFNSIVFPSGSCT